MMNNNYALDAINHNNLIKPVDMPYVCMPEHGQLDRILDAHGNDMPHDWTGLAVTAVSTKDFWKVDLHDGRQIAIRIGRFNSVNEALNSLTA